MGSTNCSAAFTGPTAVSGYQSRCLGRGGVVHEASRPLGMVGESGARPAEDGRGAGYRSAARRSRGLSGASAAASCTRRVGHWKWSASLAHSLAVDDEGAVGMDGGLQTACGSWSPSMISISPAHAFAAGGRRGQEGVVDFPSPFGRGEGEGFFAIIKKDLILCLNHIDKRP